MGLEPPEPSRCSESFKVWPECWDVVRLFLAIQTQWRTRGERIIGLDYGAVLLVADRMLPGCDSMALLADLQIMEDRLLELLNEKTEAS